MQRPRHVAPTHGGSDTRPRHGSPDTRPQHGGTHLTCGAQAQEHGHPKRPEEEEDGARPERLEQQEGAAAEGLVCDLQNLDCQLRSPPQDKNQHQQNGLARKGLRCSKCRSGRGWGTPPFPCPAASSPARTATPAFNVREHILKSELST